MIKKVFSATLTGLCSTLVEVEVSLSRGQPRFIVIGLPSKTIEEAKERITAALQSCGIRVKSQKTVVNLAPADVRKNSSTMELAITLGLLQAYKLFSYDLSQTLVLGEMSLDGNLRRIKGALPLVLEARRQGFKQVIFPSANLTEVDVVDGIRLCAFSNLSDLLSCLTEGNMPSLAPAKFIPRPDAPLDSDSTPDFSAIIGQEQAKRALEISAAGGHNLLLVGPPGSGKSLLAKAMNGILPPLSKDEAIAVTQIYSVYNGTPEGLLKSRPFRAPHHTTSISGLIGGGRSLNPGEISLAHKGILFLDEFPEFHKNCLEALREPMEDGQITHIRSVGRVTYPARFALIAAANPCPCGFKGTLNKNCTCGPSALESYGRKFSGPIMDRLDMIVRVQAVPSVKLSRQETGLETTAQVRSRVISARHKQQHRYRNFSFLVNAEVPSKQVFLLFNFTVEAKQILDLAADKLALSARSYFKVARVARTIADLNGADDVSVGNVSEALQYRK